MSALIELQHHLDHYWTLPFHENDVLKAKLDEVQTWQRERIQHTHKELFEQPKNQPMAHYFLTQLYGGDQFKLLAEQLVRILPKAKKLERLAKESVLETGSKAIQTSILAIELDTQLAEWLVQQDLAVNEQNMLAAYRTLDKSEERRSQINNLKDVCYRTDKYLNSFVLRKAFGLTKSTAYRHGYQPLYDFIQAGFDAMKPLKSVGGFIEPFCERELLIVDQVHNMDTKGQADVFAV